MKKLVTIFALFTLVMLTSFVEPTDVGGGSKNLGSLKSIASLDLEVGGGSKNLGSLKNISPLEVGGGSKNLGSL